MVGAFVGAADGTMVEDLVGAVDGATGTTTVGAVVGAVDGAVVGSRCIVCFCFCFWSWRLLGGSFIFYLQVKLPAIIRLRLTYPLVLFLVVV